MATSCSSLIRHSQFTTLESPRYNMCVRTTFLTTWLKPNSMTCLDETQQTRLLFKLKPAQSITTTLSFQTQTNLFKIILMAIITTFSSRLTLERFRVNYLTKIVLRSRSCLKIVSWAVWAMKFNKVHFLHRMKNIHWICFLSHQIFTQCPTIINKISCKAIRSPRNNKLKLTTTMSGVSHKYLKN
jgi:hypothetical protein